MKNKVQRMKTPEDFDYFNDFYVSLYGKNVKLNAIGGMIYEGREFLVLTDMKEFELESNEYGIVELQRKEGEVSIVGIEDDELYEILCDAWEYEGDDDLGDS